ncbi:glycoside hydrolase family 30 protein [Silvibacterium acidisoli]|uniref:glycoside hydrolase family 30 protein n=1 Tax=Acidobacteriaceae bacterium ZG23-2 TaxID=2883246 RepID=UPI00406C42A4
MEKMVWSRRQLLKTTAGMAAGSAFSRLAMSQMPPPEPMNDERFTFVTTTEAKPWQTAQVYKPTFTWTLLNLNVDPAKTVEDARPMQGFGGCFNELGWTSLSALSEEDRASVMHELFDPKAGARFNYCRMPIGANDFATEAYSYDETDGDFELKHFSIDHDRKTLIPFIHAAMKHQPELKLWASPWTPPGWMKRNRFYAEAKAYPGMKDNGIRPEQVGHEGEDMFIQEPRYFETYAKYFGRFIDAYRAEGIRVGMVMPQNEFNSAQNFPSCTWTPEGLAKFLHYLGPEMRRREVDVFFGTLERGNPKLLETVMMDREAAAFVKGVGVQWAGKNALPQIHREFPALVIYQSEQECGDGRNDWSYTGYCWQLMKHYFRSGASGYMYWNISTGDGGLSTWGWSQNSLVSVNRDAKTFRYNHDYYLLKHLTHFVDKGAKTLETNGTCDDALAFANPDGSMVLLLRNEQAHEQLVQVAVAGKSAVVKLPADSVATLQIRGQDRGAGVRD